MKARIAKFGALVLLLAVFTTTWARTEPGLSGRKLHNEPLSNTAEDSFDLSTSSRALKGDTASIQEVRAGVNDIEHPKSNTQPASTTIATTVPPGNVVRTNNRFRNSVFNITTGLAPIVYPFNFTSVVVPELPVANVNILNADGD